MRSLTVGVSFHLGNVRLDSRKELVTAAMLAKGYDPTNTEEWARLYRRMDKFSRPVLEDIVLHYRQVRIKEKGQQT